MKQHIQRVHVQARVWEQACISQQTFIDPEMSGFYRDASGNLMMPHITDELPEQDTIVEEVSCQCTRDLCLFQLPECGRLSLINVLHLDDYCVNDE